MSAAARPLIRGGKNLSSRLLSVDIYRGIVLAGDDPGRQPRRRQPCLSFDLSRRVEWLDACRPHFPFFVFLVGMSLVLAVQKRLAGGEPKRSIFFHVCRRSILLIAIGVLVNGFPVYELASWRWEGVLQRIAICYFFSAILVLWSDWKGVTAAAIVCLVGYWFLLRFVPVPGLAFPAVTSLLWIKIKTLSRSSTESSLWGIFSTRRAIPREFEHRSRQSRAASSASFPATGCSQNEPTLARRSP